MNSLNNHDIVVIGGSAGGIDATRQLLGPLPKDLPAALFIVIHSGDQSPRVLDRIFAKATQLDCVYAEDGMGIEPGRVYIAPPDRHMVISGGDLRLVRGPTENRVRPSVDVLFRSAAAGCRGRTIGVVLSGNLNDGAAGLLAIKSCGGLALVQDPDGIDYAGMPESAIAATEVDGCIPITMLGEALIRLVHQAVPSTLPEVPKMIELETQMAVNPSLSIEKLEEIGELSTMTCPECGGALLELEAQGWRFRCRVGHAFTAETMVLEQKKTLESALWLALRTLENDITLRRRLLERERSQARASAARRMQEGIAEIEDKAAVLRKLLFG